MPSSPCNLRTTRLVLCRPPYVYVLQNPVVSTMAIPGMNEMHAFAPLEAQAPSKGKKSRQGARPVARVSSMPTVWTASGMSPQIFQKREVPTLS